MGLAIYDSCTGCRWCQNVCPTDAITVKDGFIDGQYASSYIYINYYCIECGSCAEVCPEEAIIYTDDDIALPPPPNEGGGGGGDTSNNNLSIDIDLLTRINYPILGKIVDNLYNKVKNDSKLLEAIKKFSHLDTKQVLDNLKVGSGPKLVVTNNFSPNKVGEFKNNTIYINKNHITQTSYIYKDYSTALEFYITVAILHEFIHFGENMSDIFLPHNGNTDDVGFQFENDMYGGRVFFNPVTGALEYEKIKK